MFRRRNNRWGFFVLRRGTDSTEKAKEELSYYAFEAENF